MNTEKDMIDMEQFNLITEELKHLSQNQELLINDLDNRVFKTLSDLQVQIKKLQNSSRRKQAIKDDTMKTLELLVNDLSLFDDTVGQTKILGNILKLICKKFMIVEARVKSLEITQDFLIEDMMNMTERVTKLTDKIE